MLLVNHYQLRSDIKAARTCYDHPYLKAYCGDLRKGGWDASEQDGQVVVYHLQGTEPDKDRRFTSREVFAPKDDFDLYCRSISAHIGQSLWENDFVRMRQRHREYISRSQYEELSSNFTKTQLLINAHLKWSWDIELHEDLFWVVPLAGRSFITKHSAKAFTTAQWDWLCSVGERLNGVNIVSGKRGPLIKKDGVWLVDTVRGWEPAEDEGWRVSLNMEVLEELGCSVAASRSAQFSFDKLNQTVLRTPSLVQLLANKNLYAPNEHQIVSGEHLKFYRGFGRDLKDVHRLGILEPPPQKVCLIALVSRRGDQLNQVCARDVLRAQLTGEQFHGMDSFATIWGLNRYGRGFDLPPFCLPKKAAFSYDNKTGQIEQDDLKRLKDEIVSSSRDGSTLVALVIFEGNTSKTAHDSLMKHFYDISAVPLQLHQLSEKQFPSWINIALTVADKAGATPWELNDIEGADEQTVFVGVDLGHNHQQRISNIGLTLFDHKGKLLGREKVRSNQLNERIPLNVFRDTLRKLLFENKLPNPDQVVVHRDGCFLKGEADDLIASLHDVSRLTLVNIKKDSCTRLSKEQCEGTFIPLDEHRAILVTNTQSINNTMPKPLEVEVIYSNYLNLQQVVSQVFWFTRVFSASAYHAKRLPATTGWANNTAGTGNKIHMKAFI